ncbi:MAG: 4-phosphoerythronate dehydrogenase [Candidatus Kapaibacterium sp.]
MNIVIDSNIVLLNESLETDFNVITFDGGELTPQLLQETKAEVLFVRSTSNCDVFLLGDSNVRFVGTATAGIDNLDLEFLDKNNIKWTNAAGSNSISVAEFTTLAIQTWCEKNQKDISELTLGIVGFGNIGSKVGKIFEKHCKQLLVTDPYIEHTNSINVTLCSIEELLSNSDIITFHTPLVSGGEHPTYKLLDLNKMDLIKKDALIINAARGGVVDEQAIQIANLNPNNLIFDVWENEPNIDSEFAASLFISTPHIAGHSFEGKLRGTLNMLQSLELYLGKSIDKSLILTEINRYEKYRLSSLKYIDLCNKLEKNIQLDRTNSLFKEILNSFDYKKFNQIRKEYPKHNETLSDDSF